MFEREIGREWPVMAYGGTGWHVDLGERLSKYIVVSRVCQGVERPMTAWCGLWCS